MQGDKCKYYYAETKSVYIGSFDQGKRVGEARFYDGEFDEIYEGEFSNDKK